MTQGIQKQVGTLPSIEPKFHLLQIGGKVFRANLVPRSDHATLEERECGFDRVGVNVAFHVDVPAMADGLVLPSLAEFGSRAAILVEFVREKHIHIRAYVLLNESAERARLYVLSMEEPEFSPALPDADHYFLVFGASSRFAVMESADIGFVHFDLARQHWTVGLHHGVPDTMAEVPRGFIADADSALNLTGRNSVPRLTEKQGRKEPRFKREM